MTVEKRRGKQDSELGGLLLALGKELLESRYTFKGLLFYYGSLKSCTALILI